jgi:hypothetical protein
VFCVFGLHVSSLACILRSETRARPCVRRLDRCVGPTRAFACGHAHLSFLTHSGPLPSSNIIRSSTMAHRSTFDTPTTQQGESVSPACCVWWVSGARAPSAPHLWTRAWSWAGGVVHLAESAMCFAERASSFSPLLSTSALAHTDTDRRFNPTTRQLSTSERHLHYTYVSYQLSPLQMMRSAICGMTAATSIYLPLALLRKDAGHRRAAAHGSPARDARLWFGRWMWFG